MSGELRHESIIHASPREVWDVLLDTASWPQWNPTLPFASGPLEPGATVRMKLRVGTTHIPLKQIIGRVQPPRTLTWRTINVPAVPTLMWTDRVFELVPVPGGVRFVQSERSSGPAAALVIPFMRRAILAGFADLAEALGRRLEQGEPPVGSPIVPTPVRPRRRLRGTRMNMEEQKVGPSAWRGEINQHETFDHDSIDSLFYDWDRIGDPGLQPRAPLKFYVPRTTDDVVRCVKECRDLGQVLIVRSKGHSSNDLVTPVGGAVLLTEKLVGVLEVDQAAMTVTAHAGTPSADVDDHLAQLGFGLPVIGDHAHITVGGFAAVGGITASSFRYGMFVDVVQRLEYVDWDGEVHTVSRDDDAAAFNRLLTGLGRHGVITKVTVSIIAIRKYDTYWENDSQRYETMDEFIAGSRELCAAPPEDARFLRGLWVDFPLREGKNLTLGTMSVYRDTEPSLAQRAIDAAGYGSLHRLGWMAGRLPAKIDKLVKMVGLAGVVLAPKYATVKNAEYFTEKIIDATVGDPQRFLVVIAPIAQYEDLFRRLWDLLVRYRDAHGCFTFLTLYVKSIRSSYLAKGDPDNERWVEFLFYVGVDPDLMTDTLLQQIADELDDLCVETGAYRYMHTRTGRDPQKMARFDPNASYNDGVSVHPMDRQLEA